MAKKQEEKKGFNPWRVAATAGIAYIGYRNKGDIAHTIKKTLSNATVSLSRTTEGRTFRGAIGEWKNMTEAAVEVYGSPTPKKLAQNMLSTSDRDALLKKRLTAYNRSAVEKMRGLTPRDVSRTQQMLSSLDENADGFAIRNSAIKKIQQLEKTNADKYSKYFGNETKNASLFLQENIGLVLRDVDKTQYTPDGKAKINLAFQKKMLAFNSELNPGLTNPLRFDPTDAKQTQAFYEGLMNYALDVRSSMDQKTADGYKNLYKAAAFHAERTPRMPGKAKGISKAMQENGFRPVTMGDAIDLFVVERNGRKYASTQKVSGSKNLEDFYSSPVQHLNEGRQSRRQSVTQRESGVAKHYVRTGKDFGIKEDDLRKDLFSSALFLNPDTNEIINTTGIFDNIDGLGDYIQENWQVPKLRMNPLDMTQRRSRLAKRNAENLFVHKAGNVMPFLDQKALKLQEDALYLRNQNSLVRPIRQDYIQANDRLIDTDMATLLQDKNEADMYKIFEDKINDYTTEDRLALVSVRSGIYKAHAEGVSGYTNIELDEQGGVIKKLFGLGQEEENLFQRMQRGIEKFGEPDYSENLTDSLFGRIASESRQGNPLSGMVLDDYSPEYLIDRGYAKLYGRTRNLSPEAATMAYDPLSEALSKRTGLAIDLWEMNTDEGTLKIAEQLFSSAGDLTQRNSTSKTALQKMQDTVLSEITQTYQFDYLPSQSEFLHRERYLKNRDVLSADTISDFVEREERGVRAVDDLKRLVEEYGILIAEEDGNGPSGLFADAMTKGTYSHKGQEEINNLRALGQWTYFQKRAEKNSADVLLQNREELVEFYGQNKGDLAKLDLAFRKADHALGSGVGDKMDNLLGRTTHTPIKQHRSLLKSINESWQSFGDGTPETRHAIGDAFAIMEGSFEYAKQVPDLFAGRNGGVSTLTTGAYFMTNRLNTPLEKLGLGLPNHLKGSAQSVLFNQWGRRIVLPFMAYQTAKYVDGLTGDFFSDNAADAYVNMHEDINSVKEATGLNRLGREFQRLVPWQEQVNEWLPNKVIDAVTFGAFSDFRSGEEVEEYYASGEDGIRKGRYWGIGSNSPWFGGKIDRYEPNWYRKAKSDYQFSENMYGSESEYWANNWMPTLTHPFAPIRHFITDPYHYEEKHAESRPYAVTGGFAELDNIPLIGGAVDSVVSGLLKPERKNPRLYSAHKDYLTAYNERLTAAYINMNAGGVVNIGPSGAMTLSSDSFDVNFKDENGNLDEEALIGDSMRYNAERDRMAISLMNDTGVFPAMPAYAGQNVPEDQIAALEETYGKGNVAGVGTAGGRGSSMAQYFLSQMNSRLTDSRTTSRSDQVSQAGTLASPTVLRDLSGAVSQNSLFNKEGALRDFTYSAGEFAGMYGFLSKTAFGFEESGRGATLESSERFSSYNNFFWEKELGGLGGDLSEIGRRYVPRDPNKDYYNPIRNTMPGWMPGAGYFTDFLHGDPYAKISGGEMRLPGEAYEKLYNVRKDAQGNYSAFDRYRILADVAPYSDQYRAAKKEVSLLNQNGYLDEDQKAEYKQIREQVSSRMKKKTFYEERFQNAQVRYETVTVKQQLDQNTFTTEEYEDNPFKLAGVSVKADDEENKSLISQFIKPGQKLKVAIDADPNRRIRDDMMDTMRVVVYTPHAAKDSLFGLSGLGGGQNLNYYLSQQSEENGGTVSIKDDESATSTMALFTKGQLTVGGMMENIVHNVLPNVPIVNIFADKFLQVRSPVESYKRELYSKAWRDWKEPIEGWIKPMLDTSTSRNPLVAFGTGYGIGFLAGRKNRGIKGLAFGLFSGVLSGIRTVHDFEDKLDLTEDKVWLPERRRKEREVDEYFDKLKYVKYKGLYEKAKQDALSKEGMDLDAFFEQQQTRGKENKTLRTYLEWKKKQINILKDSGQGSAEQLDSQLADIKMQLQEIDGDRPTGKIGPYTALALRYKDEYESTLYGATETYDYNKIYRALPNKDKQYFTAFQKASPRERQEILNLVPENQKRIYQQQFGLKVDKKESLQRYFRKHALPDENWEGWQASRSLDNIKIKVMQNEGMDLTEANYWDEDQAIAEASDEQAIPVSPGLFSSFINTGKLEEVLRGAGLNDVRIGLSTAPSDGYSFDASISIERDRSAEVASGMETYMTR